MSEVKYIMPKLNRCQERLQLTIARLFDTYVVEELE